MAFELGYSMESPDQLVIREAQCGFLNAPRRA
jgi:2-oxoglutarate dehydrogenase complex dehydrogenase (E1) component-like enzyme